MTDDRFERELRGFLAARAPAGASPRLRAQLATVTTEVPVDAPPWRIRTTGPWRGAVRLAATAAAVVLLIALIGQWGRATIRENDTVGAPSNPSVPSGAPFIDAPAGFFTAAALADAEARLGGVFAETGIEATFVIKPVPGLDALDYTRGEDRDGDDRLNVAAVAGITPDDTIVCCITITGATIEQARQHYYWQPLAQPSALDDELAATTAAERDAALEAFVRGIEDLALAIAELGVGGDSTDVIRTVIPVTLVLAVLVLAVVGLRRPTPRPATAEAGPVAAGDADAAAPSVETESVSAPVETTGSPATWSPLTRSDRRLVLIALAALGGLALVTAIDAVRTADPGVRLDPVQETIGIAHPGIPIVPTVLAATTLVALVAYAARGGLRRRLGGAALMVILVGSSWLAFDQTRPAARSMDIVWVSSRNGTVTSHAADGSRERLTYDLTPNETFTFAGVVGNRGILPLTILGLDGVRPSTPNPHVASIVGLGWVPQPIDGGRIAVLNAGPEGVSMAWPLTLSPGEEAGLVIVGRAGECAQPGGTGPVLPLLDYRLTYRVMGVERSETIGLAADLFVPAKEMCIVSVAGGTITYGPAG